VNDLVEEPHPPSGFVDPVIDQAPGGYAVVLAADVVSSAQVLNQFLV
jgi:hypothetical protein